MDLRSIDLNLLVVLDAIAQRRSVTRAAEQLGLSQPATSAALARLRAMFDDPLFVKAGAHMQPTPRALALAETVHRVLGTVQDELLRERRFDAAQAERRFTVLMPDIGELNVLPPLLRRLTERAPNVKLRTRSLGRGAAAETLALGEADLAVGYYPDLQRAGFFQQRLFRNRHVCIVRRDHPTIGERLTSRQFQQAAHVVVRPDGREHVFEQYLQAHGWARQVQLEVSHFAALLPIIASSDLVATVPHALAESWVSYGNIRLLTPPMKVPMVQVHQFWHRRMNKDAAHAWLRAQLFDLFGNSPWATIETEPT